MMSLTEHFLVFVPVFLVVNLVAAVCGRESLREIVRHGLRNFVYGTVIMASAVIVLNLLFAWWLGS